MNQSRVSVRMTVRLGIRDRRVAWTMLVLMMRVMYMRVFML